MGVKGLWTLLEPAARPVRLETLSHKRLAIDASIWLYQLLKAMKDDEGNPLDDAHILGFYRRICKLLYYDIRPVFVFDGTAPELKRITIGERRGAREARGQDAKRAARLLLQTQIKLHAISGGSAVAAATLGTNASAHISANNNKTAGPMTPSPEKKRKRDEYELPPMHEDVLSTRTANERDLRMAHPEDLQQLVDLATRYPDTFGSNLGDIDIDIDSAEFQALSAEDQHDIIVALKVRSRQTSHDRLQRMLGSSGNALDFSKQQIELLVKRNTLTQQWLQVTGNAHRAMGAAVGGGGKVARGRVIGERSREYVLIKGDDPAGGWTLKMGGGGQSGGPEPGDKRNPIAVVDSSSSIDGGSDESDDELFEDVSPARIGGQLALRTASPYADPRSGADRDIRQDALERELVSDDQPLLQPKQQQYYQLQQSIIAKHSHVAGVQAPGGFGSEP
ncbi:DNA repair protein rad2, partial [Kickxella alabastrina]